MSFKQTNSIPPVALLLTCMLVFPVFTSCMLSVQVPLGPPDPHLHNLLKAAGEEGSVRLQVRWKMEGLERESLLTESRLVEQRERIGHVQQAGIEEIEAKNLNIRIIRNDLRQPITIIEADETAILYLYYMDSIERIMRDSRTSRGRTFS